MGETNNSSHDPVAAAMERLRAAGAKPVGKVPQRTTPTTRRLPRTRKTRMDGRADLSYRDPQPMSNVLGREVTRRGWKKPLGVHRLMNDWDSLVGEEIARHTTPVKFDEKNRFLHIQCDSTPWTTQLRYMQPTILSAIAAKVGPDVVTQLKIHAPNLGPQRRGKFRVQGRGVRDDYG